MVDDPDISGRPPSHVGTWRGSTREYVGGGFRVQIGFEAGASDARRDERQIEEARFDEIEVFFGLCQGVERVLEGASRIFGAALHDCLGGLEHRFAEGIHVETAHVTPPMGQKLDHKVAIAGGMIIGDQFGVEPIEGQISGPGIERLEDGRKGGLAIGQVSQHECVGLHDLIDLAVELGVFVDRRQQDQ